MNKIYFNKPVENFYSRDLNKIKEQLDAYYTLCMRFNSLANAIQRAGFYYDDRNNIFDIAELFIAYCLKSYGINITHIVDKIITEEPNGQTK